MGRRDRELEKLILQLFGLVIAGGLLIYAMCSHFDQFLSWLER